MGTVAAVPSKDNALQDRSKPEVSACQNQIATAREVQSSNTAQTSVPSLLLVHAPPQHLQCKIILVLFKQQSPQCAQKKES